MSMAIVAVGAATPMIKGGINAATANRKAKLAEAKQRQLEQQLKNFEQIEDVALQNKVFTHWRICKESRYKWLHFLHQYQLNDWLTDDMGLGKTVQTLCFLQKLKEDNKPHKSLIIVPVTTIANWEN